VSRKIATDQSFLSSRGGIWDGNRNVRYQRSVIIWAEEGGKKSSFLGTEGGGNKMRDRRIKADGVDKVGQKF